VVSSDVRVVCCTPFLPNETGRLKRADSDGPEVLVAARQMLNHFMKRVDVSGSMTFEGNHSVT